MRKIRGDLQMTSILIIYIASSLVMFVAIYIYNNQEKTAFHKTQEILALQNKKVLELDGLIASNISTVATANARIKEMETKLTCYTQLMNQGAQEIEDLQEHCAKLRESQINIKDMLSNKRPSIKLTVPVPVSIQANPETVKKIKSQLKGLSK